MLQPQISDLKKLLALSEVPDDHLQWIIDHSDYHEFEDGAVVMKTGDSPDHMFFFLEGSVKFYMDVNGRLIFYIHFQNDERTGGLGGLLPYSRMKVSPGYSYASGHLRVLALHKDHFAALERLNSNFIQRCIGIMTERAKHFATMKLQQEKVNALGKLAAGIAHELNNPAAAVSRISSDLRERLKLNYSLTDSILEHCVDPAHIRSIRQLIEAKEKELRPKLTVRLRLQLEDELMGWLQDVDPGLDLQPDAFIDAGISREDLEQIRTKTGELAFRDVVCWLENLLISDRALMDLEEASSRISGLVSAIKSHVHMDRTNEKQPANIQHDVENTLVLLNHKLKEKNITVSKDFEDHLPVIEAYVGELNQVWTNLIDNAIYASPRDAELLIRISTREKNVEVRVIDHGAGIPEQLKSQVFDPFFTTKAMGEGSGIGLDTVKNIVERHNGEIKLNSNPGYTEFIVCLPILQLKNTSS